MVLPKPKRILYDENGKPVFVEFDYEEWMRFEPFLESLPEPEVEGVPDSPR